MDLSPLAMIVLHAFMLFPTVFLANAQGGTVQLAPGVTLDGEQSSHGYTFYGIRYGNARRFEYSTENMDFAYLRNPLRPKAGPICPQVSEMSEGAVMDEDCLYLDVYVPFAVSKCSPLPVLMYIHGGGLREEKKDMFNGSSLAAAVKAVVVTTNYRLGALGFLSTGDNAAKGNFGLADCKLAVNWVKKHISKFGGNPNELTVFGQSAGAALVSAILLDQSIRSSVHAAAMMSGSVLLDILYNREPKKAAVTLGKAMDCPTNTSAELVICLKQKPLQDILQHSIVDSKKFPAPPFVFVVDHEHLRDIPIRAVQSAASSAGYAPSILTGYLREDSAPMLTNFIGPQASLTLEQIRDIVAKRYLPTKDGGLSSYYCSQPNFALADRVLQYYNITDVQNQTDALWKLYHIASHAQFGYRSVREALLYSNGSGSTQLYRIAYTPGTEMGNTLGSFHGLEVMHIFEQFPEEQLGVQYVKAFRDMLQQLIYSGRMNGPTLNRSRGYLEKNQSGEWTTGEFDQLEMLRFWEEMANTPCSS